MRRYSLLVLAVALLFAIGIMAQTTSSGSSSTQYPSSDQTGMQSPQSGGTAQPGTLDKSGSYGPATGSSGSQPGASGPYDTQTGTTGSNSGAYGTQTGAPSNAQPGMGTAGQSQSGGSYGSQTGTYGSSQSNSSDMSNSNRKGKEKTVEGCVVRRETDYFIFPKNGQPEHIASSGQDVSTHLGHHVKLHGTEQPSSAQTAYGTTSGGTSGMAGSASSSSGSGSNSGSTGNVGANTAGTTGNASTASGSVNESDTGAANNKEIVVDRLDMISESCPSNIQKNVQASGMSISPR